MKRFSSGRAAGLLLLALLGCERPFEPLQPNDNIALSIYGYLDASVDTQWVRVMPIRGLAATSPAPIDVSVRLEHLGSGKSVELRDSLFAFPASNIDPPINRYARNFWTTEKMEPGASYRVTATRSDGVSVSTMTRVPKDVPEVVVGISQANAVGTFTTGFLRLPGAEYLAMVNVIARRPCGVPIPSAAYHPLPRMGPGTGPAIQVSLRRDFFPDPARYTGITSACLLEENRYRWWDIYFVLTGSPWAFPPDWSELEAFLEGAGTNVENGTGFLGGVITRTVPFERCYLVGGSSFAPFCELTYNARSASVAGFVMDLSCPNDPSPLRQATVFIWEDDRPDVDRTAVIRDYEGATVFLRKPDGVKVRAAVTDLDGSYRIGALEPGVTYAVSVNQSGFQGDEDRFLVRAGERVRLDLELVRPRPNCR